MSGDDTNNDSFCVTRSDNVTSIGDATLTAAGKVPLQSTSATQCAGQSDTQFIQSLLAASQLVLLQTANVTVQSSDGRIFINASVVRQCQLKNFYDSNWHKN